MTLGSILMGIVGVAVVALFVALVIFLIVTMIKIILDSWN